MSEASVKPSINIYKCNPPLSDNTGINGSLYSCKVSIKNFLSNNTKKIAFIHFDLDTYESTSFVLKSLKKDLQPGTIILFDEFYGFPNWEKYEYKAFKEEIEQNKFKYIAFGSRQACIKII